MRALNVESIMTADPSQRDLRYGCRVQCAERGLPGRLIVKCKFSWREIFFSFADISYSFY
jgi:hypothetical protein